MKKAKIIAIIMCLCLIIYLIGIWICNMGIYGDTPSPIEFEYRI